jgi:peptide/nickel transport system permease protein
VLPALTLALTSAAADARYVRGAMLEVVRQDYIRTARAKGAPEWRVYLVHALRNALLPTVALFGLRLPYLFSGAVVVEKLFAWSGLGMRLYEGLSLPDVPLVTGAFFLFAILVALGGLVADVAAAAVDPRIRIDR